jgi:MFS family permease
MYLTDRRPSGPRSAGRGAGRVATTVVLMGTVSLFTDISSESISAILALYLTTVIGLGPLAYGFVDGIYQGVSSLVRILGGWMADRSDHPKWVAAAGYGLSMLTRLALLPAHTLATITTVIGVDRLGKGVRTAPRDAVIAASASPDGLGRAFGVHRTFDTAGALIGPFLAFAILASLPGKYDAVFVVSFGAAVVGFAVLLLLVPDVRPRRDEFPPAIAAPRLRAQPVPPVRAALRNARFRRVVLAVAILGPLTISDGFLYLALQHRDDLAIKYFPLLYVGTNFAYLALAYPLGRLADRIGRARVFMTGHLALLLAYLGAGGPVSGTAVTIGCLFLLGTYYAATDGQLSALTSPLFEASGRGTAIATAQTALAIARSASSLMFGALWAATSQDFALIIVAIALATAIPVAWIVLRPVELANSPA